MKMLQWGHLNPKPAHVFGELRQVVIVREHLHASFRRWPFCVAIFAPFFRGSFTFS